jgi:phage tail sheath protein FI
VDDFNGLADPASTGRPTEQGLAALEQDPYRDVALVYAPDVSTDIAKAIVTHCENMRFRFAVIDSPKGQNNPSGLNPRNSVTDTKYGAFYYPWLFTSDPKTGARKMVPPGGHMLGIYARTDTERGVFKAPANEIVRGALALEFDINDRVQDDLNPKGVNVVREFPGRGIRLWGARTMTSDALWKYVSVRRLFIFLERSIYEGTQWVVFEPNDDRLWARVIDTIRLFLRGQWRLGALFGRTEQEAFFITCDRTTMTQDDILNGRLICEIGIAPVRPAEFVIFRIFQHTAEAQR